MSNKYRIQVYKEGNGKLYFTPQEKVLWFFWVDIKVVSFGPESLIYNRLEFNTPKEGRTWIDNTIQSTSSKERHKVKKLMTGK